MEGGGAIISREVLQDIKKPEVRLLSNILDKFQVSRLRWPPTLDVTKWKAVLQIRTWWMKGDDKRLIQNIGMISGPVLFAVIVGATYSQESSRAVFTAGTCALMAFWWILEAIPLPITALLPLVLFPLTGVMDGEVAASYYLNSTVFLMIGGFFIAIAMEKWNLHKRIATKIVLIFGVKPRNLLFGLMFATYFSSFWVSNTAATMMMLPNAAAVIAELEQTLTPKEVSKFSAALYLGLAFASAFGGTSILPSSPPNLILAKQLLISFPKAPEVTYVRWFFFGFPISFTMFVLTYALLYFRFVRKVKGKADLSLFEANYKQLGPIKFEEGVVIATFVSVALLWLFRADMMFGSFVLPGWANIFPNPEFINDGTVAVIVSTILFMIPAREPAEKVIEEPVQKKDTAPTSREDSELELKEKSSLQQQQEEAEQNANDISQNETSEADLVFVIKDSPKWTSRILGWKHASKLPWDVVLLFGGGFALSAAFKDSGLSVIIGESLQGLSTIGNLWLTIVVSLVLHVLTEFTSNTACTQITQPILASLAVAIEVNPLLLMFVGVFASSYSFMMPMSTPPNMIVFATGKVKMLHMITTGIVLKFLSIVVVNVAAYTILGPIFGESINDYPLWASEA